MSSQCRDEIDSKEVTPPRKATYTVIMVRHGQSEKNATIPQRYSGWDDTPLNNEGIQQAKRAGIALREAGFKFDVAYSSLLTRAQRTLDFILAEMGQENIPRYRTWRLNERHFGAMNGMSRDEIIKKYGECVLKPFNTPPPMSEDHPDYESIRKNMMRYKEAPAPDEFPRSESMKQTIERTVPYWNEVILPQILNGNNVLIVGHGANLKGLAMYLEGLSEEEVDTFTIPNAKPFLYEFDENMKPVVSRKYLIDEEVPLKDQTV